MHAIHDFINAIRKNYLDFIRNAKYHCACADSAPKRTGDKRGKGRGEKAVRIAVFSLVGKMAALAGRMCGAALLRGPRLVVGPQQVLVPRSFRDDSLRKSNR